MYNFEITIIISACVLGCASLIGFLWSKFQVQKSPKHRSGSGNRKNRDRVINELRALVLKNSASIESFALMVGALMKKVESFEHKLTETDDYIHDELPGELDVIISDVKKLYNATGSIDNNLDKMSQDIITERTRVDSSFQKVQHNFLVMNNNFGNFSNDDYTQFCEDTTSEIKNLHNAIFIPIDDDDDYSSD